MVLQAGVNHLNTKTMCAVCSKLTIRISERRQSRRSGVFNVNFEQILSIILVFLHIRSETVVQVKNDIDRTRKKI